MSSDEATLLTWRLPEQKRACTGLVVFARGGAAVYTRAHTALPAELCLLGVSARHKPLLLGPEKCSLCRHHLRG